MALGDPVPVLEVPVLGWGLRTLATGLIEAARRRQHRRRRRATAIMVVVAAAAAVVVVASRDGPARFGSGPAAIQPVPLSPAAAVLAKAPYMAVSCPVANSIACDRVGLAVLLRRPAYSVTATIAGRPLDLDYRTWAPGHAPRGPRTAFSGFLRPAGIVSNLHVSPDNGRDGWFGTRFPEPPLVRLRVRYAGGNTITTQLRVNLATGWG